MILVGDSLGMCVYGYPGTVPVTMDQCIVHCEAVRRAAPDVFVVGDMPFMSYQISDEEAVRNAGRFLKGGRRRRHQARGRRLGDQPRQGDPRRRHRGLRPHRPHSAELRTARWPQGPGPYARVGQARRRRRPRPLRGRRPAAAGRSRAARGRRVHPRRAADPGAGHRRRRAGRRPAPHRQRRAGHLPGLHSQVRQEVRRPGRRRHRGPHRVRRRRARPAGSPRSSTATTCSRASTSASWATPGKDA